MSHRPGESLDRFRARVVGLEKPSLTSPLYSRVGWPVLAVGVALWLVQLILPGNQFFTSLFALILIVIGAVSIVMSLISAHSESVEESEHSRLIRERDAVSRCLYLEGKIPDGRGSVGRCRLYEFDMTDLPYCLYCREYTPSKGEPEV